MAGKNALTAEYSELVQPEPLSSDALPGPYVAMCLLANNPAKLVTALALESFPPEQYVDRRDLSRRLRDMQKGEQGWSPSTTELRRLCWSSLRPAGILEYQDQEAGSGVTKDTCRDTFRLNQAGRFLVRIVAGAYLPVELKTLDSAAGSESNIRLPLRSIMGRSAYDDGQLKGTHTRLTIFEALMPLRGGLSQDALVDATGLSHVGVNAAIKELSNKRILVSESIVDDDRIFELSEQLSQMDINSWPSGTSKVFLETIKQFRVNGIERVTARRILDQAGILRSDLTRQQLNEIFWDWMRRPWNAKFVHEDRWSPSRTIRTRVAIADEHRAFIREILRIKKMLLGDGPGAKVWQEKAGQWAKKIVSKPEYIASLMRSAKGYAPVLAFQKDEVWAHHLARLIPPEGISLEDLHRSMTDEFDAHVHFKNFKDRLNRIDGISVMSRLGQGRRGHAQSYVMKDHSPEGGDLRLPVHKIMALIPRQGISAEALYLELVHSLGKNFSYANFISQVREHPDMGILETPGEDTGVYPEMLILKKVSFSRAWADHATCRDMDPEDFYPISNPDRIRPAAQREVEAMKRVCSDCPVRLPCLRAAIDAKEKDAIRGGFWFANDKEVTREMRNTVQRMVHIQTRS